METSADFSETYDIFTSSDDYARRFAGPVGEWMLGVQMRATLRMLSPYPGASVLDVGGGHGQLTGGLLANGHRVTILGSAEECASRLRHHLDAGRIEFDVGSFLEMPYADRAFDVVIAYRLMAHMTRWREFLLELARVADRAVMVDYAESRSLGNVPPWLFGVKKRLEPNTRRFRCFRERELVDVFAGAGFGRSGRYAQYFVPMALHRALGRPRVSAALERACRLAGLTSLFGSPVILKAERDHL